MSDYNWKNGTTISDAQYTLIKKSIREQSIRRMVTCITTATIILLGFLIITRISTGKITGCAFCISAMLIMGINAYDMIQNKIGKIILQKNFKWRDATCQSVKYDQIVPRRYSSGNIILDDGSTYDSMQLIHDFQPGQKVIVVSIGNDGSKYAFTVPNEQGA